MYKRLFAIILSLAVLCCCGAGSAEAPIDLAGVPLEEIIMVRDFLNQEIAMRIVEQNSSLQKKVCCENEIKFRNIEWGASASEVRMQLADQGVISSEHKIESDDYIYSWTISADLAIESNAGATISVYDFQDSFNVAGYPLSAMWIYCPYEYQYDSVDRSIEGTRMMYARMKFDVTDLDLVYEDLTNKLSSLYGQPEEIVDNNSFISFSDRPNWTEYNTWRVWYGANNTGVFLYKTYQRDDGADEMKVPELILAYGKTDGIDYMKGMQAAIANEAKATDRILQEQNANNTDGL